MSYLIHLTNDANNTAFPLTIPDGTTNNNTGVTLIGRNYTGYGAVQNDNFIRLLENFADDISPIQSLNVPTPLVGTLWYDTGNSVMKVYDGTNFNIVSGRQSATVAPTPKNIGDQWWDTSNLQLKTWTGTDWHLIGPNFIPGQAKTGAYADTIVDTLNTTHTVVGTYIGNNVVAVTSTDTTFATNDLLYTQFGNIGSGLTLKNGLSVGTTLSVAGTSQLNDDVTVGGQLYINWSNNGVAEPGAGLLPSTTNTYDLGSSTTQFRDYYVGGNLVLTGANLSYNNSNLSIVNSTINGNINASVSTVSGPVTALSINGASGLIKVSADPVDTYGVATKNYVDTTFGGLNSTVVGEISAISNSVGQLRADYLSNIATITTSFNDTINAVQTGINANVATLTTNTATNVAIITANLAGIASNINSIVNIKLPLLANINSPAFTGTPTAPTPTVGDSTTNIATTAFVTGAISTVASTSATQLSALATQTIANTNSLSSGLATNVATITANLAGITNNILSINSTITTLANINSPIFTGTPSVPTPPALTTYFNTVSATTFSVKLNNSLTVVVGDTIIERDTDNNVIASMTVQVAATSSTVIIVTLNSGTITPGNNYIIYQNGSIVSSLHVISASPGLTYSGLGDLSTAIATTAYVDATANILHTDYNSLVSIEATARATAITNAVSPLAPKANPIFTGTPIAPTPATGDNTTTIATTAFVKTSVQNATATLPIITYGRTTPVNGSGKDGDVYFLY